MSKFGQPIVIFFLIAVFLLDCKEKPDPPLPFEDDKIINVLIDVHLAEATMQSLGKQVKDSIKHVYYDQIAQIHDIEREDLDVLMVQLRNRPNDLKRLYEEMMKRIEVMEKENEARNNQDKKDIDSTDVIQVKELELQK